eukprot:1906091-Rhodomonas_salina.1
MRGEEGGEESSAAQWIRLKTRGCASVREDQTECARMSKTGGSEASEHAAEASRGGSARV